MPEHVFTCCHGCGAISKGKHYACPQCGSQHVRQQDISWLYDDDHGATFHPPVEEAG
jgi:hypothetical protein